MKRQTFKKTIPWILCGTVLLSASAAFAAPEEEMKTEERITHAVKEAQELAQEWAVRVQEWKSNEAKPTTYMGVVIESVPEVLRDYIDLPKGVGLLLVRVSKDGPAAKAGLQDNDILVEFDGQLVINYSQLSTLIDMKGADATVPVKILRKGEEMMFDITLEERIRKGARFIAPDAPDIPDVPDVPDVPGVGAIPDPEHLGVWVGKIDEWVPGSVRVFIDENEEVHVDLQELKDNLDDLENKLQYIHILKSDIPGLVKEHGDMGARTTVVRIADKTINYSSKEGKVALTSSEAGQNAMVWDAEGKLIYEGDVPEDYDTVLPEKAVRLIKALQDSREKLHLGKEEKQIEIKLNQEDLEPVTWIQTDGHDH